MTFRKKFLRYLLLCSLPFLFSIEIAFATVPAESSHYNNNTYTNLNTLTSTGSITFTIAYDTPGDVKWYKDNVLVQTNTSTTTASLTTAWTAGDYGMVRQIRVNSTSADGSSNDTIWNVEVQQTGTATVRKNSHPYQPPTLNYKPTLYITNGWTNLPSLYLAAKQEDNAWIEYVSTKTYLLKAMLWSAGATVYITADTADEIRIQGVSPSPSYFAEIQISDGGMLKIDKVKFYVWDTVNNRESTIDTHSPNIRSAGDNQVNITNSCFRHIRLHFRGDRSPGDIVDNNIFVEGSSECLDVHDEYNFYSGSRGQIITNNAFIHGKINSFLAGRHWDNTGMVLKNNKFIFPYGSDSVSENVLLGEGLSFIGNEVLYSHWNMVECTESMFGKYNNLHDNGGWHQGFNAVYFSVNDYCHHFTGFGSFYIQTGFPDESDPSTWIIPHDIYIFNACVNKAGGIAIFGGRDIYIYNFTPYNSGGVQAQYASDHVVVRKSNFIMPGSGSINLVDYKPDEHGYVQKGYVIDTVFAERNDTDYRIYSEPQYNGNPVFYSINSYRTHGSTGTITIPVFRTYENAAYHGEVRNYAYADILVQDGNGNPLPGAAVTITPLNDANYPAIGVHLPPPPPDMTERPSPNPVIPYVSDLDSIQTDVTGHTPKPNYGWSDNTEVTPALLFCREKSGNVVFPSYSYRVTASRNGRAISRDIKPDASWLREDPIQPAKTVVLTFDKPAGKYALNVNGGTGSGLYSGGTSVNIAAGIAPSGKVFDKWIGDTTTVNDVNSASTFIAVPSSDISVTAYYKDITYHLTVEGGAGSGDYPAGRIVVVDASSATATREFYKWTGTGASSVVNPAVYSSTLIMPAGDITVTATYRDPVSYTCHLTVADGEGTDFYAPGENVPISVSASPFTDMQFDHWAGDTANIVDPGACTTTLAHIPDKYSIVYPVYRDSGQPSNNAGLSQLSISPGTLSPWFSAGTAGYTGTVEISVTSVTVTPTAFKGTNATITVNGTPVVSGSASGSITLNNSTTTITIVVTAPDHSTQKTYTVAVQRVPLATAFTLAAPSPAHGPADRTSGRFTVTPNGIYTGTITIKPAGCGVTAPVLLSYYKSNVSQTFTIKPASTGTVTFTITNSGGLENPIGVTYAVYDAPAAEPDSGAALRNACWNYPNPANLSKVGKTTFVYAVARESRVSIRLYTIAGELVKTLVNNETRAAGEYTVDWQGDTESGRKAASGVYFCVTSIGKDIIKKKIAIIR